MAASDGGAAPAGPGPPPADPQPPPGPAPQPRNQPAAVYAADVGASPAPVTVEQSAGPGEAPPIALDTEDLQAIPFASVTVTTTTSTERRPKVGIALPDADDPTGKPTLVSPREQAAGLTPRSPRSAGAKSPRSKRSAGFSQENSPRVSPTAEPDGSGAGFLNRLRGSIRRAVSPRSGQSSARAGRSQQSNSTGSTDSEPAARSPRSRGRAGSTFAGATRSLTFVDKLLGRSSRGKLSVVGVDNGEKFKECTLNEQEEDLFRRLFGNLDRTMDGTINVGDLHTACKLLQLEIAEHEVYETFDEIDDNGDGRVQLEEFLEFMKEVKRRSPVWETDTVKLRNVVAQILKDRTKLDADMLQRRRRVISEAVRGHLLGDNATRWTLDALVLVVIVYYAVMVPLFDAKWSFGEASVEDCAPWYEIEGGGAIFVFECLASAVLCIDVFMQWYLLFGPAAVRLHELEEIQSRTLKMMKTMGSDILAAVPFDLVLWLCGAPVAVFAGAHHLRLLKVPKMHSLFQSHASGILSTTTVHIAFTVVPLVQTVLSCILFVHVCSCVFHIANDPGIHMTFDTYRVALYWSLYTISSVGYGDVTVKTRGAMLLAIGLFLVTIVVNGWLVGKMTSMIMLDTSGERRKLMAQTLQIINHFHLPKDVMEDILSLQNHLLTEKQSLQSFSEVISALPAEVQRSLSLYIRVKYMQLVPLFQTVSAECKVALAEALTTSLVPRDELLVVEGTVGDSMYFIVHGFVEVLKKVEVDPEDEIDPDDETFVYIGAKPNKRLATLMKGAFFGEMSLLSENTHRGASIRSLTWTETLRLMSSDLAPIMERFPTMRWHIEVVIAKRSGKPAPRFQGVPGEGGDGEGDDSTTRRGSVGVAKLTSGKIANFARGLVQAPEDAAAAGTLGLLSDRLARRHAKEDGAAGAAPAVYAPVMVEDSDGNVIVQAAPVSVAPQRGAGLPRRGGGNAVSFIQERVPAPTRRRGSALSSVGRCRTGSTDLGSNPFLLSCAAAADDAGAGGAEVLKPVLRMEKAAADTQAERFGGVARRRAGEGGRRGKLSARRERDDLSVDTPQRKAPGERPSPRAGAALRASGAESPRDSGDHPLPPTSPVLIDLPGAAAADRRASAVSARSARSAASGLGARGASWGSHGRLLGQLGARAPSNVSAHRGTVPGNLQPVAEGAFNHLSGREPSTTDPLKSLVNLMPPGEDAQRRSSPGVSIDNSTPLVSLVANPRRSDVPSITAVQSQVGEVSHRSSLPLGAPPPPPPPDAGAAAPNGQAPPRAGTTPRADLPRAESKKESMRRMPPGRVRPGESPSQRGLAHDGRAATAPFGGLAAAPAELDKQLVRYLDARFSALHAGQVAAAVQQQQVLKGLQQLYDGLNICMLNQVSMARGTSAPASSRPHTLDSLLGFHREESTAGGFRPQPSFRAQPSFQKGDTRKHVVAADPMAAFRQLSS